MNGPTLEIYTYTDTKDQPPVMPNHAGYGHIAFEVPDVQIALQEVLDSGGQGLGKISRAVTAFLAPFVW